MERRHFIRAVVSIQKLVFASPFDRSTVDENGQWISISFEVISRYKKLSFFASSVNETHPDLSRYLFRASAMSDTVIQCELDACCFIFISFHLFDMLDATKTCTPGGNIFCLRG